MAETITMEVRLPDGSSETREYPKGISALEVSADYKSHMPYDLMAARVNQVPVRLDSPIEESGRLDLLDMRDPYGNMVYQESLTLLYIAAIKDVLGMA